MTLGGALAHAGWLGLPGSAAWGAALAVPVAGRPAVQRRRAPEPPVSGRTVRRPGRALGRSARLHAVAEHGAAPPSAADPPPVRRPVTVVVPVRDEEEQVGGCLAALLAQRGVADLRVVVVDDGSTDGTAALVRASTDPRVRLVTAGRRRAGWLGKPHACAPGPPRRRRRRRRRGPGVRRRRRPALPRRRRRGGRRARRRTGSTWSPRGRARWPCGAAERLVQPLAPWLWATTLPLRLAERSPRPSLAAANGQFLVLTRAGVPAGRGHAAVRGEVLEDIALLRAVKRAGGRGVPIDGSRLAACRMYDGWPALRDGYTKSLWSAVGGSGREVAAAAALTAIWALPPAAALRGSRAGVVGYAAGVAGPRRVAARTGCRSWPDALAHPVSILVLDVLMAQSVTGHRRGSLRWRGRRL